MWRPTFQPSPDGREEEHFSLCQNWRDFPQINSPLVMVAEIC